MENNDNHGTMEVFSSEIDGLLEIFTRNGPISKNGTFDTDLVKKTINEMTSYIVKNTESAHALKEWMDGHEFFTSPASARYHGNVKGGLAAHSLLVARQAFCYAKNIMQNFSESKMAGSYEITAEDVYIAAIGHDFCKAGTYATEFRRTKDFSGNWVHEPYFKVKGDLRNLGHGNESVLLLLESMPEMLKRRHVLEAISRHMGFSDLSENEKINYSCFLQNPLVLLIQIADQTAAQWWDI